ncbi:MAG: DUF1877 family protein, partial [Ferruginibacter sp.]|nr:DUF1877 family protein [Cytophagales bacterium]
MGIVANFLRVTQHELDEILNNSSILEDRIEWPDDPALLNIDKAWAGILYLLTGYNWEEAEKTPLPLVRAILGERVVDEEQEMGYGPARYVAVAQVKEIDQELSAVSGEILSGRFDGRKMMRKG